MPLLTIKAIHHRTLQRSRELHPPRRFKTHSDDDFRITFDDGFQFTVVHTILFHPRSFFDLAEKMLRNREVNGEGVRSKIKFRIHDPTLGESDARRLRLWREYIQSIIDSSGPGEGEWGDDPLQTRPGEGKEVPQ